VVPLHPFPPSAPQCFPPPFVVGGENVLVPLSFIKVCCVWNPFLVNPPLIYRFSLFLLSRFFFLSFLRDQAMQRRLFLSPTQPLILFRNHPGTEKPSPTLLGLRSGWGFFFFPSSDDDHKLPFPPYDPISLT